MRQEAEKLLLLKANKKMVKDKLAGMSGKVILLKDLSNLSTKMKSSQTRNDLDAAVNQLIEKHGKLHLCVIIGLVMGSLVCISIANYNKIYHTGNQT